MGEKIYKTMRSVGAWNIALGTIMIVIGVVSGALVIVGGALLLKKKSEITF